MWWNLLGRDHDDIVAARDEWIRGDRGSAPCAATPGARRPRHPADRCGSSCGAATDDPARPGVGGAAATPLNPIIALILPSSVSSLNLTLYGVSVLGSSHLLLRGWARDAPPEGVHGRLVGC